MSRNERDMDVARQISEYLAAQPERKRADMQRLNGMMLRLMPDCRLWFLHGKDELGLSANTTGISIYVIGLDDRRTWLRPTALSSAGRV